MTAGGKYINVLLVSLRMLRRSESHLPAEIFFDKWTPEVRNLCDKILPDLNARCLVFGEIWTSTSSMRKLQSYQLKIFALLFSTFEEVLFLDADAFPGFNPDALFISEPFAGAGLVTWPDFWAVTSSATFFEVAKLPFAEISDRASTESGVLMVSKRRHSRTLLLAAYYNYFGPGIYYPLLSQGAQGEGQVYQFAII